MAQPLFQFSGLASQVDWSAMIEKMMAKAAKPIAQIDEKVDKLELKKDLYTELGTALRALQKTMTTMKLPATFNTKKAEVSSLTTGLDGKGILNATADTSAAIGQWRIKVLNIANPERRTSTRVESVTDPLGMEGTFRIQVGNQWTDITVKKTDSLRELNYTLSKATDAYGNPMLVTAKLVDNRIVLESAEEGTGTTTKIKDIAFTMGNKDMMLLPKPDGGEPYPDALVIKTKANPKDENSTVYNTYRSGIDYNYDPKTGEIHWLSGTGTKRPAVGDKVEIYFHKAKTDPIKDPSSNPVVVSKANGVTTDTLNPPLADPVVVKYGDTTFVRGVDYTYDPLTGDIEWTAGKGPAAGAEYNVFGGGNDVTISSRQLDDGFQLSTPYPVSVSVKNNTTSPETTYLEGVDYKYDRTSGKITWMDPDVRPPIADVTITAFTDSDKKTVTRTPGELSENNVDLIGKKAAMIKAGTEKYYAGTDFTFDSATGTVTWKAGKGPANGTTYELHELDNAGYEYNTTDNVFSLTDMKGTVAKDLFKLDYVPTPGETNPYHTAAKNANIEVNGVSVTRNSNQIDDLIAGVKLKLAGPGEVLVDVSMDAEKAVKATEEFVTAYNDVMDWINTRLEEETQDVPPDATLNEDFYKKFGLLHGDSFLWMLKDQLRGLISYPVPNMPNVTSSKGFLYPTASLGMKGPLYVDINGKRSMIEIDPNDSLQDVRAKLTGLSDKTASTPGGAAGGSLMPFDVSINSSGKLVVKSTSAVSGPKFDSFDITRSKTGNSDSLAFTPNFTPPINGKMEITQGSRKYTQDIDFDVVTKYNDAKGTFESSIQWKGNAPAIDSTYKVGYTYNQGQVGLSGSDAMMNGFGFAQDRTDSSLALVGITTEKENYGKSGKLEFDSEKFMKAMREQPNTVTQLMTNFATELDKNLDSILSSSQVIVGQTAVTKGRLAAKIQGIDSEIKTLNTQRKKMEKNLEQQQETLYNKFVAMENMMAKLSSQMNTLSSYLGNQQ